MKDNETTSSKSAKAPKEATMPAIRKFEARTSRILEWATTLRKKSDRFESDDLNAKLDASCAALREVMSVIVEMPDDCGVKVKSSSKAFAVGAIVDIKERHHAAYEDLLNPEDLSGLTVVKIAKGKVVATTPGGIRLFLPKTHLVPSTAPVTSDEEEGDEEEAA